MAFKQTTPQVSILIAIGVIACLGVVGSIIQPTIIVQLLGFCTLIVVSLLALLTNLNASEKVERATEKVERVRTALEDSDHLTMTQLRAMEETGEKTHTLVNANMGVQLKLNAVATKRLAELTKDKDDIAAALLAQQYLAEHEKKQEIVDARAKAQKVLREG